MKTFSEFFGFREDPFKRTPDIDFYYPTKMHQEALDTLTYMLESDEPFAVIVGEPGTGKTITLRKFISELPENTAVAYILFPSLTPAELFMAILEDFNVKSDPDMSKNALFSKFRDFLIGIKEQGKKAVIIIDEAQNLPPDTLEELRILSNLETEKEKLLKIVLAGQPELSAKLDSDELRQLKQRITLYSYLSNIDESEIKNYINSHLIKAGRSSIRVHGGVVRKIARITKGNPRLVNTLMERAMIAAFLDNSYTITEDHLTSAIASVNTIMSTIRRKRSMKYLKTGGIAAALALCAAGGFILFSTMDGKKEMPPVAAITAQAERPALAETAEPGRVAETPVYEPSVAAETASETQTAPAKNAEEPDETTVLAGAGGEDIPPVPEITEPEESEAPSIIPGILEVPGENAQQAFQGEKAPETEEADEAMLPGAIIAIKATSLNVRELPTIESPRISSVTRGQEFTVLADSPYWVKINLGSDRSGWVYKQHVSVIRR